MFSVLSSARWIASPTSAISSDRPVWASPIRTVASAAVYCALMTSLRVRRVSTSRSAGARSRSAAPARPRAPRSGCRGPAAGTAPAPCARARCGPDPRGRHRARCGPVLERDHRGLELRGLQLQPLLRRHDRRDALLDLLQHLRAASGRSSRGSRSGPRPDRASSRHLGLEDRVHPVHEPSHVTSVVLDARRPVSAPEHAGACLQLYPWTGFAGIPALRGGVYA